LLDTGVLLIDFGRSSGTYARVAVTPKMRRDLGDWRIDYNCNRLHTAHGDLTPTEFANTWTTHQPKAA